MLRGALLLAALTTLAAPPRAAAAAELSARAIIDRALERNSFGFENAEARLLMELTAANGVVRARELVIRSRQTPERLSQTLVRFLSPADVAGTALLVHERADGPDDQHLYLPAFGKAKRIAATQKKKSFMGTDFTYADLQASGLKQAALTRLPDEQLAGQPVYVVEAIPTPGSDSQYGRIVAAVHRQTFIPMRLAFFDPAGHAAKELTVFRVEKHDGRWVVMDSQMRDLQRGTATRMRIQSLDTRTSLSAEDFTPAALTR